MRKGYVDTPMGQVHYVEHGSGEPIILLHQTAWAAQQYKNVIPALAARGMRVIAIDTPGFGMSDGPPLPPRIEDYADNLRHAFDGLGVKRAHIAAHHTGVSIAISFAARYPERVDRMALHGVPLYTAEEREVRLARPHFDQTPLPDGSHLKSRFEKSVAMSPGASLEASGKSVGVGGAASVRVHLAVQEAAAGVVVPGGDGGAGAGGEVLPGDEVGATALGVIDVGDGIRPRAVVGEQFAAQGIGIGDAAAIGELGAGDSSGGVVGVAGGLRVLAGAGRRGGGRCGAVGVVIGVGGRAGAGVGDAGAAAVGIVRVVDG